MRNRNVSILAFSLVELSIVLVILGLLTGGILAGQSLIRAAELRSVAADYSRYTAAIQTFRDKYLAIPGDMPNATRFWGRLNSNANCVTNSSAAVAAPGTCDGNGDGSPIHAVMVASTSYENLQFWRHLALAGLIEGQYTGLASSAASLVIGENVPAKKISNGRWWQAVAFNFVGDANVYALDYGNYLSITTATGPILRPEEAWNIDTKFDDGKPAYGKVIAVYWNNLCAAADDGTSANNDLNASYRLTDATVQCALNFRQSF